MSLFSKYPELEPVSMFIREKEGSYHQHEPLPEKVDVDVLFIFGIFPIASSFKALVKKHRDTEFVFLVETLEELLFFINKKMDKGFDNDRIHVHWKDSGKEDVLWAEEIASIYPYEKVLFLQNGLAEDRYNLLTRTFLRKIVLETSVHKELLNYPLLCENLFENIHLLSRAFDIGKWKDHFKGTPAVIAGAGPSLTGQKENLKQIQDRALIFAGGSTITVLDRMGISPHLLFAIDPNKEEYQRLRYCHGASAPLIYGNRVQKDIFRFFPGEIGYLRSDTGGLFEAYVDDKLEIKDHGILDKLSEEALSVTTISLMTAIHLGCDPIYFAGVDLSVKKGAHYSEGIISSWENSLRNDSNQQTKWMMERDVIDDVAKKHPRTNFYDATGNGMTFGNIPSKKFEINLFPERGNLKQKILNLTLDTKFEVTPFQIIEIQKDVKKSLEDLCTLIRDFLNKEIVGNIFVYKVENNLSYKLFFQGMVYTIQTPLLKQLKLMTGEITEDRLLKNIYTKVLKEATRLSSLIKF